MDVNKEGPAQGNRWMCVQCVHLCVCACVHIVTCDSQGN